jgi:hypothetical protein
MFVSRNKPNGSKGMQYGRYGNGLVYLTISQIFLLSAIRQAVLINTALPAIFMALQALAETQAAEAAAG